MIVAIFDRLIACKARALQRMGVLTIIEPGEFPAGVPIHLDGSTTYDPKKQLAYFAVQLESDEQALLLGLNGGCHVQH